MKRVGGLDVHKDSVYLCILQENGEKVEEKFGTLTPDLQRLRETLLLHRVQEIAMESTSIYWIPIWNLLFSDFVFVLCSKTKPEMCRTLLTQ
jgi:hypothetical protein